MGIFSSLIDAVSGGTAGVIAKLAPAAIAFLLCIAAAIGIYLYGHEKNLALAAAQGKLTTAQAEMAALRSSLDEDQQTIARMRANQATQETARAAMNRQDQATRQTAAGIQQIIDQTLDCPTPAMARPGDGQGNPDQDGAVAPVLAAALAALSKAGTP